MRRPFVTIASCFLLTALIAPQSAVAQLGDPYETYTFEREIRLGPGEFYAVTYDNERKEFVETEPDRGYRGLPDRALAQVLRSPVWLREAFIDRLVDLFCDDLDVGEDAAPVFHDVNGDGIRDLVVGNADGELKCFVGPYFKEAADIFSHIRCPGGAVPCFRDMDGDGEAELLVVDGAGVLNVWGGEGWQTRMVDVPDVQSSASDISVGDNGSYAIADGQGFYVTGAEDGSIVATSTGEVDSQLIENLNRM